MNISTAKGLILLLICIVSTFFGKAQVKYQEGSLVVDGVTLLQDHKDENKYYYLPPYPRLSTNKNGDLEFLCIKYVGDNDSASGGLFHALLEFTLDPEYVAELQEKLKIKKGDKAIIAGQIPLLEFTTDGEYGIGGLKVISAVLSDTTDENSLTQQLVTSGHAPLYPGSKAAIAANLNKHGATLLWSTLEMPTSDVSISISAYYEAVTLGYNATVKASMNSVYDHFSRLENKQQEYTRNQLRHIVDEMVNDKTIEINVLDAGRGEDGDKFMNEILQIVTDKLTTIMFDMEAGWSKLPEKEVAVEEGQIPGRDKDSKADAGVKILKTIFSFGLAKHKRTKPYYITDNQFVLKKRTDIRKEEFALYLNKQTVIKVPVYTSGNLGGLYEQFKDNKKYFRVVDLNDAVFQERDITFQIDGSYVEAFKDIVNYGMVKFRKNYTGHPTFSSELNFTYNDIKQENSIREITYKRLGETGKDWEQYEYQIVWHLQKADEPMRMPKDPDSWIQSDDPMHALKPPFEKKVVAFEINPDLFEQCNVQTVLVKVAAAINKKPQRLPDIKFRSGNETEIEVAVFSDPGDNDIQYQIVYYHKEKGEIEVEPQLLKNDYVYLRIPPKELFED